LALVFLYSSSHGDNSSIDTRNTTMHHSDIGCDNGSGKVSEEKEIKSL